MDLDLPVTLLQEIDGLVQLGAFPTRDAAVAELLRLGLDVLKTRQRAPRMPPYPRPPVPPGVMDPHADEPISVDPTRDVQEF